MTTTFRSFARKFAVLAAAGLIALFALVALGAGVGRYHVLPVSKRAPDVKIARDAAVVVVPVQRTQLRANDVVAAQLQHDDEARLYRITGIDDWTHAIYGIDQSGKLVKFKLPGQVTRVSRVVPYVGPVYRELAGTAQGMALLFVAALLLVRAALQCRAALPSSPRRRRFLPPPGKWWVTRVAAAVAFLLGALAMTASATFTATQSVSQGNISTGRMSMTIPGAGATNRLTLGATAIAPGDRMQRAVDVLIDSTTTTGMVTGMTLAVTASPSSALNTDSTNGLRIFVQDCQKNDGTSGWAESGSTPAFTYSCTKGAGGSWNDLLNSAPTNDPTAVPSANTCATSSGGTSSYRAVSELSTAYTLVNLPLTSGAIPGNTTIHMVVTMCFPTAAGDTLQNINSTLTFAFAGVQRAGTNQ